MNSGDAYTNKKTVLTKYKEFWAQFKLNNIDGKLRTYFPLKIISKLNNIFLLLNFFYKRRCLTKFRISSHKLKIEMGRFTRPLTPLKQRVCDHCLMTIEDEFQFLMQCPRYSHIRSNFFFKRSKTVQKLFIT